MEGREEYAKLLLIIQPIMTALKVNLPAASAAVVSGATANPLYITGYLTLCLRAEGSFLRLWGRRIGTARCMDVLARYRLM